MKAFVISTLAAGLALTSPAALAQTGTQATPPSPPAGKHLMGPMTKEQHRQQAMEMFAKWDANSDGTVTRDEFMAAHNARFEQMDTNKDGTVTPEERRAYMRAHGGKDWDKSE